MYYHATVPETTQPFIYLQYIYTFWRYLFLRFTVTQQYIIKNLIFIKFLVTLANNNTFL